MVKCPICAQDVPIKEINAHLDSGACEAAPAPADSNGAEEDKKPKDLPPTPTPSKPASTKPATPMASIFARPTKRKSDAPPSSSQEAPPTSSLPIRSSPSHPTWDSSPPPSPPPTKKPKISNLEAAMPLPERLRPKELGEIIGQPAARTLASMIRAHGSIPSILLHGPPGCGKTTLAKCVAKELGGRLCEVVGGEGGVGDVKKVFVQAKSELALTGRRTVLFCDEIHRFTKAQQDVFLGPVERGEVVLIGATTENPTFRLAPALLSRLKTFTLVPLSPTALTTILERAIASLPLPHPHLSSSALLSHLSTSGDARTALNLLSYAHTHLTTHPSAPLPALLTLLVKTSTLSTDTLYDHLSALQKSIRGSSPDGALYYLASMLHLGFDPLTIVRRLIVIASEDIGIADNSCLPLAIATLQAIQSVGMPEARLNLAHCVTALALAPKGNRAYKGFGRAMAEVERTGGAEVPVWLKAEDRNVGYVYPHDYVGGECGQGYLPRRLEKARFLHEQDEDRVVWDGRPAKRGGGCG